MGRAQDNFDSDWEVTDVLICGCGPTGAMLSSQLGQAGVPNICLDRETGITTDPRGIALDEDGIRALQSVGIYDKIYSDIGKCMGNFNFVGGVHHDLHRPAFTKMDYATTEGGTGHVGFICHKQPALEKHLRNSLLATKSSQLRVQCTLVSITEDDEWVYAQYEDKNKKRRGIKAKFLVGADGKTGYVRKHYLEAKGVRMEHASLTTYEEDWVALNWKITLPTRESHPDFPLWERGYSSEEVYDLFFPQEFRFLCNPERPAVCGRFGLTNDRLWRFEFVVQQGEDGLHMASPEMIKKVVYPYLVHPGSRYGLAEDIAFPEDCIETLRSRPFRFSARSCNKWAVGRVILCGDSAHVFPPFGGQGIASGFRDACGLAWRLQLLCRPGQAHHTEILKGWYQERKQQLEASLAATVENGAYVTEQRSWKIFARSVYFAALQMIPSWKRWLEMGARRDGMQRYQHSLGMFSAFIPELNGGLNLPQVYCSPLHGPLKDTVMFTDDVIFSPRKQGLFQLLVLVQDLAEITSLSAGLQELNLKHHHDHSNIDFSEATFVVCNTQGNAVPPRETEALLSNNPDMSMVRLASGEEFALSPLCANRPEPLYFDENRLQKELGESRLVLVRPDRFVFAACRDIQELGQAVREIPRVLDGER